MSGSVQLSEPTVCVLFGALDDPFDALLSLWELPEQKNSYKKICNICMIYLRIRLKRHMNGSDVYNILCLLFYIVCIVSKFSTCGKFYLCALLDCIIL